MIELSLIFKKITCDEFIKNHNHINYCEAIIYVDGDITWAVPSHVNALSKIIGLSQEELNSKIPITESPIHWLIEKTGCISIWYDSWIYYEINEAQRHTLKKLYNSKIIGFKIE